ncbi:MAG: hypothetical protein ACE15D_18055 [Candidatus Eisenbacteria bacterium]|nr:hypothetical protein [Candidatus Eisenbacteria bacterium]
MKRTRPVLYIFVVLLCGLAQSLPLWDGDQTAVPGVDTKCIRIQASHPLLSTHMWGGSKPALVPLAYKILGCDPRRILLAQTLFSIMAWGSLAIAAALAIRSLPVALLALLLLLGIGTSGPISSWNGMMLTESFSLSLLASFAAASLWLVRRPGLAPSIALVLPGAGLALARDTNAYALLLLGMLLLPLALRRAAKPRRRLLYLALAASFVAIWFGSLRSADVGKRWLVPFYNVVCERVLTDPHAAAHFQLAGMPWTDSVRGLAGKGPFGDEEELGEGAEIAAFCDWARDHGRRTYARFLLAHPGYSLLDPPLRFWQRTSSRIDKAPAGFRSGLVDKAEFILNRPISLLPFLVVFLAVVVEAVWLAIRRRRTHLWVPILMLALAPPQILLVWHGDACEVGRHSIGALVQVAVGLPLLLLFVADYLPWSIRRTARRWS